MLRSLTSNVNIKLCYYTFKTFLTVAMKLGEMRLQPNGFNFTILAPWLRVSWVSPVPQIMPWWLVIMTNKFLILFPSFLWQRILLLPNSHGIRKNLKGHKKAPCNEKIKLSLTLFNGFDESSLNIQIVNAAKLVCGGGLKFCSSWVHFSQGWPSSPCSLTSSLRYGHLLSIQPYHASEIMRTCCHLNVASQAGRVPFTVFKGLTPCIVRKTNTWRLQTIHVYKQNTYLEVTTLHSVT